MFKKYENNEKIYAAHCILLFAIYVEEKMDSRIPHNALTVHCSCGNDGVGG
jgi:hypothetical protein